MSEKWETLRDNLLAWDKFLLTLLQPDEEAADQTLLDSSDKPVSIKVQTEVVYVG